MSHKKDARLIRVIIFLSRPESLTLMYMYFASSGSSQDNYNYVGIFLRPVKPIYPGDTRPEFKMWGGASKSLFVLVLKICQNQLIARLSVVQITICILHCDKQFYKSTPESLINI